VRHSDSRSTRRSRQRYLRAFEKFVKGQMQVLALLRVATERDEKMLTSMQK
jgi:hypothetical protein